jgi:hypothetical protein
MGNEPSVIEFLDKCYRPDGTKKVLMPNGKPLRLTFTCTERKWLGAWGSFTFKQTVRKIIRSTKHKNEYRLFIRISKTQMARIREHISIPDNKVDSCRNWKLDIDFKTYSKDKAANMIISHNLHDIIEWHTRCEQQIKNQQKLSELIGLDSFRLL